MLGRLPYRGHLCCDKLQWSRLVISLFMICGLFRWPGLTFSEFAIVLSWKFMPHYWLRLLKTKETNSKNYCVYKRVTLTSAPSNPWYQPTSVLAHPWRCFLAKGWRTLLKANHAGVTHGQGVRDAESVWAESGKSSPLHQSCLVSV